jgi:hypothetical protein
MPDIIIQDEGIIKGQVDDINFVGAGVVATVSGRTGIITIAGGGGGGGTFLQGTVDFGTASPTPSAVTATIADAGVGAASIIIASVVPGTGRDMDEMELGPVVVSIGNIVAGVSFDVIAVADDETAHGQYIVNYTRN